MLPKEFLEGLRIGAWLISLCLGGLGMACLFTGFYAAAPSLLGRGIVNILLASCLWHGCVRRA